MYFKGPGISKFEDKKTANYEGRLYLTHAFSNFELENLYWKCIIFQCFFLPWFEEMNLGFFKTGSTCVNGRSYLSLSFCLGNCQRCLEYFYEVGKKEANLQISKTSFLLLKKKHFPSVPQFIFHISKKLNWQTLLQKRKRKHKIRTSNDSATDTSYSNVRLKVSPIQLFNLKYNL